MQTLKKLGKIAAFGLAGGLLNTGTMFLFQNILRIPLFMDTMFTVTFTFFGGLPCGIFTAILSHVITNPLLGADWPTYLYIFCNIAVALVTAVFMRLFPAECSMSGGANFRMRPHGKAHFDGIFDRAAVLFVLSLVMCVVISLLGGLISTVIETFFTPQIIYDAGIFIFRRMLSRKGLTLLAVEVLCRIPVNILDRLVSVFAGYAFAAGLCRIFKAKNARAASEAGSGVSFLT